MSIRKLADESMEMSLSCYALMERTTILAVGIKEANRGCCEILSAEDMPEMTKRARNPLTRV